MSKTKRIALGIIVTAVLLITFIGVFTYGYQAGRKDGEIRTLTEIQRMFEENNGNLTWIELPDGSYNLTLRLPTPNGDFILSKSVELHLLAQQYRNGQLISESFHAMTLTNGGKLWIVDNLFNSGGANGTKFANYIGCSNSSAAVDVTWNCTPSEITTDGLERALMSWTATGSPLVSGNLTKTFTASGTNSTKMYGLYEDSWANNPVGGLIAAEQQGVGAQKNMIAGDTLAITIMVSVS